MTLGGVFFIKDGIRFDYCFKESIKCLCELCDEVSVVEVGSTDNTIRELNQLKELYSNLIVTNIPKDDWDSRNGRERISFYQNIALSMLSTEYYYLQQADEVTHEDCFPEIRKAIETGGEAFYVTRKNLWKDCNHELDVPQERKPCSTEIIRLAKSHYKSVDDGESLEAPASTEFLNEIVIWHYGFVRRKEVMKAKIMNMQDGVFEIPHDPKLDNMEVFDWSAWFSESDLKPITEEHPKFIKEWIKVRP